MSRRLSYRGRGPSPHPAPLMAGAPAKGRAFAPGSSAAAASSGMSIGTLALGAVAFVVAVAAVVGMAVVGQLLADNVSRIDKRIGADRESIAALQGIIDDQQDLINDLEDDIEFLNDTMPEGNGTVFFDDEWVMAYSADHSRQFMFDASQITTTHPTDRRTYIAPDANGTLALLSDIPPPTTTFAESAFAVYVDGDPTTELQFDLTLFTAGTDRVAQWPNKSGTVAYLADIIAFGGNSTNFLDSAFAIRNDPDTSKVAVFSAALLTSGTQREYAFPDKNGTLALLSDVNTMGGGTVFLDVDFAIWNDADNTKVITVNASLISSNTTQEYWFPDLSGEVVLTEGLQTVDDKTLEMTNTYNIDLNKHTFYGDGNASMTIDSTLPWSDHENVTLGMPGFAIATGNWGLPVTNLAVGTAAFDDSSFAVYYSGSMMHQIAFDLSNIPGIFTIYGPRDTGAMVVCKGSVDATQGIVFDSTNNTQFSEILVPDKNGTMALLSDIGSVQSTFSDAFFTVQNDLDNTKQIQFDVSGITTNTTRIYGFPDYSADVVVTSGLQTVDDKILERTNTYEQNLTKLTFHADNGDTMSIKSLLPWVGNDTVQVGFTAYPINKGNRAFAIANTAVGHMAFDDVEFAIYSAGSTDSQIRFDLDHLGNATSTLKAPLNSGTLLVAQGGTDIGTVREAVFDLSLFTAGSEYIYNLPDKNGTVALLSDIGGSTSTYGFRQVKDGGLVLVSGTTTIVTDWHDANVTFNYDNTGGDFNPASGVFTVGAGQDGYYSISASIYVPVTSGTSVFLTIVSSATDLVFDLKASVAGVASIYASTMAQLAAGETIDVRALQFSGGNATLSGGVNTHFSCHRIA